MKAIKALLGALLGVLASFSDRAQACHAEFGEQVTWPAVSAATDLRSYQYRVARFPAAQTCNVASNAGSSAGTDFPAGIIQNKPNSGEAVVVAYFGPSKAVAGAAVTARGPITTNGSGKVIDAVSGNIVIGRAQEACTAQDEIIGVVLMPPVRWGDVT